MKHAFKFALAALLMVGFSFATTVTTTVDATLQTASAPWDSGWNSAGLVIKKGQTLTVLDTVGAHYSVTITSGPTKGAEGWLWANFALMSADKASGTIKTPEGKGCALIDSWDYTTAKECGKAVEGATFTVKSLHVWWYKVSVNGTEGWLFRTQVSAQ